jgi:hypothetical protein
LAKPSEQTNQESGRDSMSLLDFSPSSQGFQILEKPAFVIQGTVQQHERLKVTLTKLNLKLTTICPLDD